MPVSRRSKEVALTQVQKRGKERRDAHVHRVVEALDKYAYVYLLGFRNSSSATLQALRRRLGDDGVLIMANGAVGYTLGKTEEASLRKRTHLLARLMSGLCGLVFTDKPVEFVEGIVGALGLECFAHAGEVASRTVTVPAGPLDPERVPFSIEPYLRTLGLPTALKESVVHVLADHTICRAGDKLSASQARLLKQFGHHLSATAVTVRAYWSKEEEDITLVDESLAAMLDDPESQ